MKEDACMHDAGDMLMKMSSMLRWMSMLEWMDMLGWMLECPQRTECFGACCRGREWSLTHWALLRLSAYWWRSGTGCWHYRW